jgi:hypothetical protein
MVGSMSKGCDLLECPHRSLFYTLTSGWLKVDEEAGCRHLEVLVELQT